MRLLSKIKTAVCNYVIIKEWVENGEFKDTDKIIVIGTKSQAAMVKYLFSKTTKKVYYTKTFDTKHTYKNRIKWIVFDSNVRRNMPLQKDYNILAVPNV